jgi:hypothetical protein
VVGLSFQTITIATVTVIATNTKLNFLDLKGLFMVFNPEASEVDLVACPELTEVEHLEHLVDKAVNLDLGLYLLVNFKVVIAVIAKASNRSYYRVQLADLASFL